MTRTSVTLAVLLVLASGAGPIMLRFSVRGADDQPAPPAAVVPATVQEARTRARMLHETIHGALQVMHRDFFDPTQRLSIPSRSLEDVFKELERLWQVNVHWLAVNAEPMNVDHKPRGST